MPAAGRSVLHAPPRRSPDLHPALSRARLPHATPSKTSTNQTWPAMHRTCAYWPRARKRGRSERGRYFLCAARITGGEAALDGTAADICRMCNSREFIAILSRTAACFQPGFVTLAPPIGPDTRCHVRTRAAIHDMEWLTMNLFPLRGVLLSQPTETGADVSLETLHWKHLWRDCQHHRPPSSP